MQAIVAEEGSPIGMLNAAFMMQHGLGYNNSDRHALAYDLLLRAARLEQYYGDGLVDAAALVYDGDRSVGIPMSTYHYLLSALTFGTSRIVLPP